jgi:hypothetical protein
MPYKLSMFDSRTKETSQQLQLRPKYGSQVATTDRWRTSAVVWVISNCTNSIGIIPLGRQRKSAIGLVSQRLTSRSVKSVNWSSRGNLGCLLNQCDIIFCQRRPQRTIFKTWTIESLYNVPTITVTTKMRRPYNVTKGQLQGSVV